MLDQQYVVFKLGVEKYGVNISGVSSINERVSITKIPDAPPTIAGIMNLRGDIIPVVDLKKRFNIRPSIKETDQRILVYKAAKREIGFIVDDASQVFRFESGNIEPAPSLIVGKNRAFISGVGKYNDEIVVLLDFEKILSEEEMDALDEIELKG